MTSGFELDARLAKDTIAVADLPLCAVRLMNDAQYPWLVVVPRVASVVELLDLSGNDRERLWQEVLLCSHALKAETRPDKLNVAALGNVVAQLHIHVIARYKTDVAWPKPVWGVLSPVPYVADAAERFAAAIRARLADG